MFKIIVTTDFSENSKSGILFALQLASQTSCELLFYNVIKITRPLLWTESLFENYKSLELERNQKLLQEFVEAISLKANLSNLHFNYKCDIGTNTPKQILEYAKKTKADYISIGTRGASKTKHFFGSNTAKLIKTCPIPLFVIPQNYKPKKISSIWYASDFEQIAAELKTIEKLHTPLNAKVKVIHYDYLLPLNENILKHKKIIATNKNSAISFEFKKLDIEYSLAYHLQRDLKKSKPTLLILFTKQNRTWFEKIFLASKTIEMTFDPKIPILIFKKHLK